MSIAVMPIWIASYTCPLYLRETCNNGEWFNSRNNHKIILGIDINENSNGVFLPKNIASKLDEDDIAHSTVHTKKYYFAVWERLEELNDPISVRQELQKIAQELANGTFPYK